MKRNWKPAPLLVTMGLSGAGLALALSLILASPAVAAGGALYVNTTADVYDSANTSVCSLREAITAISNSVAFGGCPAGAPGDTIYLQGGATYLLTRAGALEDFNVTGDLNIRQSMNIRPLSGRATIQGGPSWTDRILMIQSQDLNNINVALTALTISGGTDAGLGGGAIHNDFANLTLDRVILQNNTAANYGGALANITDGLVTMTRSLVMNNSVLGTGGVGGGIYNFGTLVLVDSAIVSNTVLFNTSTQGGGLALNGFNTLRNVTVSGNRVSGRGGGVLIDSTVFSADFNNVSIYSNTADAGGGTGGGGGGIYVLAATAPSLGNSILAGNVDAAASGALYPDCARDPASAATVFLVSLGYNLIGSLITPTTTNCEAVLTATDQINISPLLGPLANNGGSTLTHKPLPGSPAIDHGNPATPSGLNHTCELDDQRGFLRTGHCDVGAYDTGARFVVFLPVITK